MSQQRAAGNLNAALTLTRGLFRLPRRQAFMLAWPVLFQGKQQQRAHACRILKHAPQWNRHRYEE
jgi:hypothetical protein